MFGEYEWNYEDDADYQLACNQPEDDGDLHEDVYMDDEDFEDDGQPSEYEEWQDLYGGDDWDHGQYDSEY